MSVSVLLIDDDPSAAELMSVELSRAQFQVQTTPSGEEGIRLLRQQPTDLVILDLLMPRTETWHVCKTIRLFSTVPMVVLSPLNEPAVVAAILDAGADDYLIKPVPAALLVAHLNQLARRAGALEGAYLSGKQGAARAPRLVF